MSDTAPDDSDYRPRPKYLRGPRRRTNTQIAASVVAGSPEYLRIECRRHAREVINRLLEIVRSDDHRAAYMAGKELLDRGFGKAPVMIQDPMDADGAVAQAGYVIVVPSKAPAE